MTGVEKCLNPKEKEMKTSVCAIAALFVASFACSAQAQCGAGKSKETAARADGKTCHQDKKACAQGEQATERNKLLAAAGAPLMQYKVGDRTTRCPKQAAEWSKANDDLKVRYVVNETEYTDKAAALQAYQAALDEYLPKLSAVQYAVGDKCVACPLEAASLAKETGSTVQYRVASFTFADRAQAERAAEAARTAADKVRMTCVVNGKEYACDKEAKHSCCAKGSETTAKSCEYKVGEMKTCCETTAKVELTSARIIAAYQALALAANQQPSGPATAEPVVAGI
jgi:hypothetical protein